MDLQQKIKYGSVGNVVTRMMLPIKMSYNLHMKPEIFMKADVLEIIPGKMG